MKNLTFLLFALISTATYAQKGIVLMLDFTPGVSMALNNEDFDRGRDLDLQAAFAFTTGFNVGYSFNDKLSLVTGIGFQSHKAAYVHERDLRTFGGVSVTDPNNNKKFSRSLGYVRVPLYLQIGGSSGDEGGGFFFRFGPTFNFLTGARYLDDRFVGYSQYDAAIAENPAGIDVNKTTDLWTSNNGGTSRTALGTQGAIYNSFVLGLGLDIGGQIRLAENFKMVITLHLETTLTNPEGEGASSYAHNINEDVMQTNILGAGYASDVAKLANDGNVFYATYPNYTNEDYPNLTKRETTYNVFGGLTFGFSYTIPVD